MEVTSLEVAIFHNFFGQRQQLHLELAQDYKRKDRSNPLALHMDLALELDLVDQLQYGDKILVLQILFSFFLYYISS